MAGQAKDDGREDYNDGFQLVVPRHIRRRQRNNASVEFRPKLHKAVGPSNNQPSQEPPVSNDVAEKSKWAVGDSQHSNQRRRQRRGGNKKYLVDADELLGMPSRDAIVEAVLKK
ncbi:hypothetical protein EV182_007630, partial [Spiromyces aspiralis]